MKEKEFIKLIKSLGVEIDERSELARCYDTIFAIIINKYGVFWVNLRGGEVRFRPTICSRCRKCAYHKDLCFQQTTTAGGSNLPLSNHRLFILTEICAIQNEIVVEGMANECFYWEVGDYCM